MKAAHFGDPGKVFRYVKCLAKGVAVDVSFLNVNIPRILARVDERSIQEFLDAGRTVQNPGFEDGNAGSDGLPRGRIVSDNLGAEVHIFHPLSILSHDRRIQQWEDGFRIRDDRRHGDELLGRGDEAHVSGEIGDLTSQNVVPNVGSSAFPGPDPSFGPIDGCREALCLGELAQQ